MSLTRKTWLPTYLIAILAKKKPARIIFLLVLIALPCPIWLPMIGEYLVVADPLQKADAVVLLAGDENERTAAGVQLFQRGYSEWLILTDIHLKHPEWQGIYITTVKQKAVEQGVPAGRVLTVPGPVATTYEEAQLIKEFSASRGFRSLLVVTSPYHTRRARWILREVFYGSDISIIIYPALNHPYHAENWWRSAGDRRDTFLEYTKMLGHILGCREYGDCGPLPWKLLRH
jgi:uncharacterized SAM-binding protein YcdF (DUF218 family)